MMSYNIMLQASSSKLLTVCCTGDALRQSNMSDAVSNCAGKHAIQEQR